jgi:raffinose/stachyose/melibiose transport system permease protein
MAINTKVIQEQKIKKAIPWQRSITHSLKHFWGYIFLLPALVLYLTFVIIPFITMFIMPFFISEKGMNPKWAWVGLANFQDAVSDMRFSIAIMNNIMWALCTLIFPLIIGFLLADVLARAKIKGRNFFRTFLFVPQTLASVVVGVAFMWIYNPRWGMLNSFLSSVGLGSLTRPWLGDPNTALFSLIVAGIWREIPFFMVVFLSGIQKIPTELYDAAKVDGANAVQEIIHVTVPCTRPELTFMALVSIINGFRVFDIVQVMTKGGPFFRTEVLGHLVFVQGFNEFSFGKAAAVGIILTAIIFVTNSLVLIYREKNE